MIKKWQWLISYLGIILIVGFIRSFNGFNAINWLFFTQKVLLILIGGVVGFYFIFFEKLIHVFYLYPDTKAAQWVKQYIKGRKLTDFKSFLQYFYRTDFSGINRLVINSVLFHFAWVIVAFFTLTSTSNIFGKSLVMGLGFYLVWQSWQSYLISREEFSRSAFWQIKRKLGETEIKYYLYTFSLIFIFLSYLLV